MSAVFLLSHCGSSGAGGPSKLIVAGATALVTGPCNTYIATLQDGGGNPFKLTADVTITLTSTGSGAFFETLGDCAKNNPETSTTAKSGTSTKSIFYKDYTAEAATLTAAATGLPSASLKVIVSHQAFTATAGLNGYANGLAQDAQGRILVTGQFTSVGRQ